MATPAPKIVKRAASSAAATSAKGDHIIALAKAWQDVAKAQEGFSKAVQTVDGFTERVLQEQALSITAKTSEFDDLVAAKHAELEALDRTHEEKKRRLETDLEHDMSKRRRAAAVEYLKASNEEPIDTSHLAALRAELKTTRDGHAAAVESAVAAEQKSLLATHSMEKRTLELTHKAEMAQVQAENTQLKNQIESVASQVASLKADVEAGRQLTRDVANSASQSKVIVQSDGSTKR